MKKALVIFIFGADVEICTGAVRDDNRKNDVEKLSAVLTIKVVKIAVLVNNRTLTLAQCSAVYLTNREL